MKRIIPIILFFIGSPVFGESNERETFKLIQSGSVAEVESAIKGGLSPDYQFPSGMHLLEPAIIYQKNDTLKLLLEKGASPDPNGLNGVLAHACSNQNQKAIELLVKYGADINKAFLDFETQNYCLHEAVLHNNNELIEFLLKLGAEPSNKDKSGKTALDISKNIIEKQTLISKQLKSNK